MEKRNIFKLDLHTHTSDFTQNIFSKTNKREYLINLLNNLLKKGDNLVIGLVDFNDDTRFEKFAEALTLLPKTYYVNKKSALISIKKNKKTLYIVRADEIATEKGHILIIGNEEKIKTRNLNQVLQKAKQHGWIVIADHPLHYFSLPYFFISKIIDGEEQISLSKKEIQKNKKYIDAVELNAYFPEDRKKIKQFAKKQHLPLIADSDAHAIQEFFKSYIELKDLDMASITTFKISFRKSLRNYIKIHLRKHEFIAKYKHGLQVILETIRKNIGMIKN